MQLTDSVSSELKKFFKNSFTRNVVTLFTGSALAQVFPFLITPVLGRLFTPIQFGIYGQVNSVMQVLGSSPGGRYGQAVVVPKSEDQARALVHASFLVTIIFTLVSGILLYLFDDSIRELLSANELGRWLLITPVFVLLVGLQRPFNFWLVRKERYRALALLKIVQTTSAGVLWLAFGFLKVDGGLILGYIGGWVVFTIASFYFCFKNEIHLVSFDISTLWKSMKEYRDFPIYNATPIMLTEFSKQATIFLITYLFTLEETGYYNMTRMLIYNPLTIFGMAFSQVYFQKIAARQQEKISVQSSMLKVTFLLLVFAALAIGILHFWGTELFAFILGEEWAISGRISEILIISYALQFVVLPISTVLTAIKEVKLASVYPLVYFLAVGSLLFIPFTDFSEFIYWLTIAEVSAIVVLAISAVWAVRRYELRLRMG
jgi:O-antigen/teichoic acid export membrane protein